jgi:hypothetical protein
MGHAHGGCMGHTWAMHAASQALRMQQEASARKSRMVWMIRVAWHGTAAGGSLALRAWRQGHSRRRGSRHTTRTCVATTADE